MFLSPIDITKTIPFPAGSLHKDQPAFSLDVRTRSLAGGHIEISLTCDPICLAMLGVEEVGTAVKLSLRNALIASSGPRKDS